MLKHNLSRKQDPTQQSKNREAALSYLRQTIPDLEYWMMTWFRDAPTTRNDDRRYYYYLPPEEDQRARFEELLIGAMFITGNFFLADNIEGAFRSGVFATERDLALRNDIPSQIDYYSVLFSREYEETLARYTKIAEDNVRAIATRISTKMANDILLAMQRGEDPEAIEEMILAALASFEAQVTREVIIAINQGNGEGRMIAAAVVAGAVGATALVEHRSALLPTTRPHHAARHRKIYTVDQQRQWWATGANRINCYCSVKPILKK